VPKLVRATKNDIQKNFILLFRGKVCKVCPKIRKYRVSLRLRMGKLLANHEQTCPKRILLGY